MQIIDGQQRLTTIFMMLACLHNWAAQTPGKESLKLRLQRMLYMEADPLSSMQEGQAGRYRLRLRGADDGFFRENILDTFLPTTFRFAGVPAASSPYGEEAMDSGRPPLAAPTPYGSNGSSKSSSNSSGAQVEPAMGAPGTGAAATSGVASPSLAVEALENETWWRMYENATFMQQHLEEQSAKGLNLQVGPGLEGRRSVCSSARELRGSPT